MADYDERGHSIIDHQVEIIAAGGYECFVTACHIGTALQ
jgi:hypothetical protein